MMNNWFEAGIRYEKVMENGTQKKVTELYLVDALSFTEAEARIIEEVTPYISGEFSVVTLKRAKISEIFSSKDEVDDKFYKCKVNFITLDDKTGCEKKASVYMLVQAYSTASAEAKLREGMKGTIADYELESVSETKLMDVYPYGLEPETEETK